MDDKIEIGNKFLVITDSHGIAFARPLPQRLSVDDALLLAAYIVAIVADEEKWTAILTAVEST